MNRLLPEFDIVLQGTKLSDKLLQLREQTENYLKQVRDPNSGKVSCFFLEWVMIFCFGVQGIDEFRDSVMQQGSQVRSGPANGTIHSLTVDCFKFLRALADFQEEAPEMEEAEAAVVAASMLRSSGVDLVRMKLASEDGSAEDPQDSSVQAGAMEDAGSAAGGEDGFRSSAFQTPSRRPLGRRHSRSESRLLHPVRSRRSSLAGIGAARSPVWNDELKLPLEAADLPYDQQNWSRLRANAYQLRRWNSSVVPVDCPGFGRGVWSLCFCGLCLQWVSWTRWKELC